MAHLGPVWRRGRGCLRGRRGSWRPRPSLCVAGVALGDIDRHFAWQVWHLWHWTGSGAALGTRLAPWSPRLFAWQAWDLVTWTIDLHFAWQVWHLVTSTVILRGRRGTYGTGLAPVARLVHTHIHTYIHTCETRVQEKNAMDHLGLKKRDGKQKLR